MSKNEKPEARAQLYVDGGKESEQAISLLARSGVAFNQWSAGRDYKPEPGFRPPVLNAREGEFRGIKGIEAYLDIVSGAPTA